MGLKIVDSKLVPRGTTDFYPSIATIMAANPDAVDTGSLPPADMALFLKQAREKGFKGPIYEVASIDIPTLLKVAGPQAAEGVLTIDLDFNGNLATKEQKDFVSAYVKKYGEPFGALSGAYYVLPGTFVEAVKASQTLDTVKTTEVLQDLKYKVQGVEYSFGGKERYSIKRQIIQPIYTSVVKGGKLETVGQYAPVLP